MTKQIFVVSDGKAKLFRTRRNHRFFSARRANGTLREGPVADKRKKLTKEQVDAIRLARRLGRSMREIAKQFKISNSHVCNLCATRSWKE
jgi:hypothetical protein